jgi:putative selenate reductase
MTDHFTLIPVDLMLKNILDEYQHTNRIFGIHQRLFFFPVKDDPICSSRFGQWIETPIGVAAGPHTQLAQNIVAAWLTGARFIELKTIQTLDELNVSKPCIDMQDEGYNCEWSQELKIHESFDQYLNAWIIIHVLKDLLGHQQKKTGLIFNMSVGYNYQGILNENVQWFLQHMDNADEALQQKIKLLGQVYPKIKKLNIPARLSNNVTLSTMHGCPPQEIEQIAHYLLAEKKLHTTVKLNPTLLGKETLHEIMGQSGFGTRIPDAAFEHDLKYKEAVPMLQRLQTTADDMGLSFSVKLTNTLESENHKQVFPSNEPMMYMSGRALHPLSVKLAEKLQNTFVGKLDISFSGGANAFNVVELVNAGLSPVTVCSDLLKPGGYGRLYQYVKALRDAMKATYSDDLQEMIHKKVRCFCCTDEDAAWRNLIKYATGIMDNPAYKNTNLRLPTIKTDRELGTFDCIHAPCMDTCPTRQNIPEYLMQTATGDFDQAAKVILKTNPFPQTTGMVCDHLCQTRCTRINYDSSILIREVKRFVAETVLKNQDSESRSAFNGKKVAIIGAGPSGLTCGYYLAKAGFQVDIYESKSQPGGMVAGAIPAFRLPDEDLNIDINRMLSMGINIHYLTTVDRRLFETFKSNTDAIYIAAGAQKSVKLNIPGLQALGVLDPLEFLFKVKKGCPTGLGQNIVIIGGGNTAMDAARTAFRLVGDQGKVTIVYRRTIAEMPADQGEITAVLEEGINILELASPIKIVQNQGQVLGLLCQKMKLGVPDASGRKKPVPISDSEFIVEADTIIPAIGQELDLDFIEKDAIENQQVQTRISKVYIGGDAMRGASTAINAIADGRKVAEKIIYEINPVADQVLLYNLRPHDFDELMFKKSHRIRGISTKETPLTERNNFNLVTTTLSQEEAMVESSRCLQCDVLCNVCTTVCPNLAFRSFQITPIHYKLNKLVINKHQVSIESDVEFVVNQPYQILHLEEWCNQCGNCTTFCPTSGAPWREKPHVYQTRNAFAESEDGYFFDEETSILHHIKDGRQATLTMDQDQFIYQEEGVEIQLNPSTFDILGWNLDTEKNKEFTLSTAAEMSVVWQGFQHKNQS